MTDAVARPPAPYERRFWAALVNFPAWARRNLPTLVLSAAVAGITAYVVNVWIMAVRYDGYVVPSGSGTTGQGNLLQGGLFWALLPMLLMSVVGYRRAVGGERFWRDVRGLPRALVSIVSADGAGARVNLLWGAAAGMTAALLIGPSLGLVMSAGILVAAPTVAGNVMSSAAYRVVNGVLGIVSPSSALPPDTGMLSMAVGLLGGAASLAAGFVITDTALKLVLAFGLAALAFTLGSRRRAGPPVPPPAVMLIVLVAAGIAGLDELLRATVALADDGGYIECGESWREWWTQCEGAGEVRTYAGFGAAAGALGGGVGSFIGSMVGEAAVRGDVGEGDPALAEYVDQLLSTPDFDDFRAEHPDMAEGPEAFESYVGWREQQGLDVPPLPEGWEWSSTDTPATGSSAEPEAPEGAAPDGEGGEKERVWFPEEQRPGEEGDQRQVDPDRVAVDGEGRPLADPRTGQPLQVDTEGNVKYGDEWMSPDDAAERTALDQQWMAERAAGQQKVQDFRDLYDQYQQTEDPELRAELEAQLRQQAIEINQDFQAKAELKALGRSELTSAFDERIQSEYGRVDEKFADAMGQAGLRRGGREFTSDDLRDIRNASSAGTAGMDRDLALEQQRVDEMMDRLETVEPGSPEAQRLAGEIERVRQGIDYERWLADTQRALAATEPGSPERARLESDIARLESDAARIKSSYLANLQRQLDAAPPGSPEAQRIQAEMSAAEGRVAGREQVSFGEARAADRITIDYDKAHAALQRQLADAPAGSAEAHRLGETLAEMERHAAAMKGDYLDQLQRQLDAAPPGSAEAQRIQAEMDAAATRMAGRAETPITTDRWNEIAQRIYEGSYRDVTGGDAPRAFQGVTQSGNPEAYRDRQVLANDPANRPFAPEWASQTSDVTGYKADELGRMVDEGIISRSAANQEIARGLAKDLGTKLIPELRADPNVDPAKLDAFERMNDVLVRAGRGEIPPGQVDGALRAAVPEIPGLTLDRATELTVSNLDAATRWQADGTERTAAPERIAEPERVAGSDLATRGQRVMGTMSDIATTQHYAEQNIQRGMDPVEATAVAMAQTGAGNAAMASGVADPRSSMLGQALLPNELRGALPDQAVENFVGTGYEAGRAGLEALADSVRSGRLDTTAIDDFATAVADREGTDFFAGYARAAQFVGEETARTDGGNIVSDLRQIYETGAGREVIEQGMTDFEAAVARGDHGAALEGWSHIAQTVAEWTSDPGYEAESLSNDLRNMWEHGVGDDYWSEAVDTTTSAIRRTPLLGTIAQGYQEIASGIGESGVTGFAGEMAEGAWALAGEGADAVSNSARNAYDYVRSWF